MTEMRTPENADIEDAVTLIQVAHPSERRAVARREIRAAVAEEREACARVAKSYICRDCLDAGVASCDSCDSAEDIYAAIRARGER